MNRIEMLRRLRALSWDKEEWFVPLAGALEGVGPAEASWQPPGGGNTIWQTVNHINHYNEMLLNRMTGRPAGPNMPDNTATFGEPGNPDDAAGWQAALERTRRIAEGLKQAFDEANDADLDLPVTANNTRLEGLLTWIMHDAHHTGQIVLIRKQQGSWPARRE